MDGFLASAAFVDVVLALVALEALVLVVYRRRTGRGIATGELLANLGAGAALLLALRLALDDAPWPALAGALLLSLLAHVTDLARRWRS